MTNLVCRYTTYSSVIDYYVHGPDHSHSGKMSRSFGFLFSSSGCLSHTGLLVFLSVELQLILVHFGEVRVGINVEKNAAGTHNSDTYKAQDGSSVDDVGDTDAEWKFGHFDVRWFFEQ